jgi:hypothetical protein
MFMGVTLDWEGAVYYCNECLKDIVKEVPDAYTQEDVDKLILAYNDEIEEAKIQNEAATNILTRLRFLGFDTDKLLEEGDYGRNDDVSDEHHSGEQQVLDGNEQKTPEQNSSRKFRVHDFSE